MIYAKGAYDRSVEWKSDNYLNRYGWVVKKPVRSSTGYKRVLRGGSWDSFTTHLRVAYRNYSDPLNRYFIYGFRCVSGSNYP